jgi:hypothetical protein
VITTVALCSTPFISLVFLWVTLSLSTHTCKESQHIRKDFLSIYSLTSFVHWASFVTGEVWRLPHCTCNANFVYEQDRQLLLSALPDNVDLFGCNAQIPVSYTNVFYAQCGTNAIQPTKMSVHNALLTWRQRPINLGMAWKPSKVLGIEENSYSK